MKKAVCLVAVLALTACGSDDSDPAATAIACGDLTGVRSDSAVVSSATLVTGTTTIGGAVAEGPFCRVQGVATPSSDSNINFEVWLPSSNTAWSGRLKVNGTGGYAGATPYARLAQDVTDGFVSAGSDMGHAGGESAAWTMNHPEKVKDWGLRAHYYVTTAAKTVSRFYYGKDVSRSYFEGCSNGGRQAMMMAQRYPELFDGIASGAPSMFYPDILMWLMWTGKVQTPVLGTQPLSSTKRTFIAKRVHDACDANDGLVDGQITNPRLCTFDVASLRCAAGATDTSACLTDAEFNVTQGMYGGTNFGLGTPRYQGAVVGSEESWDPNFADNGGYGKFVGHYVYSVESPPFEWRTDINYSTHYDQIKAVLSPITAAPSPDLTAFKARGGKLLQYHGWNDPVVTPQGSINYLNALAFFEKNKGLSKAAFDQKVESLTGAEVSATAMEMLPTLQQYHRLFMLPDVGHCGGGSGPNAIGGGFTEPPKAFRAADQHAVSALMRWVEQGVAPDTLIANRIVSGASVRSRPICAYPKEAVYKGSGDINVAASFTCATPTVDKLVATSGDIMQVQNSLRQRELLTPNR